MDISEIEKKVEGRIPSPIDVIHNYAVLIPLIEIDGETHILYELRSHDMSTQPGEISFPGGKVEEGESYREAAVRETMEELNISRDNIEVIEQLDYFVSYSNITIYCFLGKLSGVNVDKLRPNIGEVDHVFTVPLDFFLETEPDCYYLDVKTDLNDEFPYNLIPNGRDYKFRKGRQTVMFYYFKDYIIWGFTAKMTRKLIEIIK